MREEGIGRIDKGELTNAEEAGFEMDMVRLHLSNTNSKTEELKKHFLYNGYHVEWESDDVITVDEEEIAYVKTILRDREISFSE